MTLWVIEWKPRGKRAWRTTALATDTFKLGPRLLEIAKASIPSDAETRIAQYKRVETC